MGRVEDHIEADTFEYDSETGRLGNFWMLRNGMMRLYFDVGDVERAFILSSYSVTNNTQNPSLNLCETAVAAFRWPGPPGSPQARVNRSRTPSSSSTRSTAGLGRRRTRSPPT